MVLGTEGGARGAGRTVLVSVGHVHYNSIQDQLHNLQSPVQNENRTLHVKIIKNFKMATGVP